MAQALWTITYNGYTLFEPQIDNYSSEAVLADDGIRIESIKHTISGQAAIRGTTPGNYLTDYDAANQKLLQPTGDILVKVVDEAAASTELANITGGDDFDGPHGDFKIIKAIGIRAAIIQFKIEWHQYEKDDGGGGGSVQDVLSHRWSTTTEKDDLNTGTITVEGSIRVRASASVTDTGVISKIGGLMVGNNPDAYRLTISPPLPSGYRRSSQRFVIDPSGNRMLYVIEMQQFALDLPKPALVGEGSFRWEQSQQDMIGRKTFECTLSGPVDSSIASLLLAAVNISKNRISWSSGAAGAGQADMIEKVTVEELDIFAKKSIRFRVTARSFTDSDHLTMPNASLLKGYLTDIGDKYADVSPYGSAQIREIRRTLRDPFYEGIDTQSTQGVITASETNPPVPTSTYQFPEEVFNDFANPITPAPSSSETAASEAHQANPYIEVDIKEELRIGDTGMISVGARSALANEIPWQIRNPKIYLISEAKLRRVGAPPERAFLAPPTGSILISSVSRNLTPRADANGAMIFTTIQKRVLQMVKTAGNQGGYALDGDARITFWPLSNSLRVGFDPRTEAAPSGNFSTDEENRSIKIGQREKYLT